MATNGNLDEDGVISPRQQPQITTDSVSHQALQETQEAQPPASHQTSNANRLRANAPAVTLTVPTDAGAMFNGSLYASPLESRSPGATEPFPFLGTSPDRPRSASSFESRMDETQLRMKTAWGRCASLTLLRQMMLIKF